MGSPYAGHPLGLALYRHMAPTTLTEICSAAARVQPAAQRGFPCPHRPRHSWPPKAPGFCIFGYKQQNSLQPIRSFGAATNSQRWKISSGLVPGLQWHRTMALYSQLDRLARARPQHTGSSHLLQPGVPPSGSRSEITSCWPSPGHSPAPQLAPTLVPCLSPTAIQTSRETGRPKAAPCVGELRRPPGARWAYRGQRG